MCVCVCVRGLPLSGHSVRHVLPHEKCDLRPAACVTAGKGSVSPCDFCLAR